jgi:hypothetical protein
MAIVFANANVRRSPFNSLALEGAQLRFRSLSKADIAISIDQCPFTTTLRHSLADKQTPKADRRGAPSSGCLEGAFAILLADVQKRWLLLLQRIVLTATRNARIVADTAIKPIASISIQNIVGEASTV